MGFGRLIAAGIAGSVALAVPAAADNIALYQCADGSQFALAFYEADTHAHIQLNGKALCPCVKAPVAVGRRMVLRLAALPCKSTRT